MPFCRDPSGVISQMISSYWPVFFRERESEDVGMAFRNGKFSLERYHVGEWRENLSRQARKNCCRWWKHEKFAVDHRRRRAKGKKSSLRGDEKRYEKTLLCNIVQIELSWDTEKKRPRETYFSCSLLADKTGSFIGFLWFRFSGRWLWDFFLSRCCFSSFSMTSMASDEVLSLFNS